MLIRLKQYCSVQEMIKKTIGFLVKFRMYLLKRAQESRRNDNLSAGETQLESPRRHRASSGTSLGVRPGAVRAGHRDPASCDTALDNTQRGHIIYCSNRETLERELDVCWNYSR